MFEDPTRAGSLGPPTSQLKVPQKTPGAGGLEWGRFSGRPWCLSQVAQEEPRVQMASVPCQPRVLKGQGKEWHFRPGLPSFENALKRLKKGQPVWLSG